MTGKSVILGEKAERDIEEAVAHYLTEAGEIAAFGLIDALESVYAQVSDYPASGSPRHAHELDLPGLRSWRLNRYPFVVFYVERVDCVEVWRVLHGQRDIPAWMQDMESG